jgi:hypothetical protein
VKMYSRPARWAIVSESARPEGASLFVRWLYHAICSISLDTSKLVKLPVFRYYELLLLCVMTVLVIWWSFGMTAWLYWWG